MIENPGHRKVAALREVISLVDQTTTEGRLVVATLTLHAPLPNVREVIPQTFGEGRCGECPSGWATVNGWRDNPDPVPDPDAVLDGGRQHQHGYENWCGQCCSGPYQETASWPCDTVIVIARVLGVSLDESTRGESVGQG